MPPKVNKLKRQTKPKKQSNIQLQRNTQLQNQKVNVVVNLLKMLVSVKENLGSITCLRLYSNQS